MTLRAWYEPSQFPINEVIESNFQRIQHEALITYALGLYTDHKQSEEAGDNGSLKIATSWKQLSILSADRVNPVAAKYAPFTTELVTSLPEIMGCTSGLTYFSLVPAGAVVYPHTAEVIRIRSQMCLVKPDVRPEDEVYIQVGGEKRTWELGKVMTFNDRRMHDVKNLSRHNRLVLLYDQIKPQWAVDADALMAA